MLAAIPALWMAGISVFVLRARFALGRWPFPGQPDPKDLGWDLHYTALLLGMPLTMASVIALFAGSLFAKEWRYPAWAGGATLAVLIAAARIDPGYIFTWFGD